MTHREQYTQLEMQVHSELMERIAKSTVFSEHLPWAQAIRIEDHAEIVIYNGNLMVIDVTGLQYSIRAKTLDELIDILEE